jgi:hypothetical protein
MNSPTSTSVEAGKGNPISDITSEEKKKRKKSSGLKTPTPKVSQTVRLLTNPR